MKIFLSWSGDRSKAVALLLCEWLKCVLQACKPWISTHDIARGSVWFSAINDQLKDCPIGIICVTQENKNRPWILFEAGALARGLTTQRVCTLLVDLDSADIEDPLAQFNATLPDKEGIFQLVRTLNVELAAAALDDRTLSSVFQTYWASFEEGFKKAIEQNQPAAPAKPREEGDLLAEILVNTRSIGSRVRKLEEASLTQSRASMQFDEMVRQREREELVAAMERKQAELLAQLTSLQTKNESQSLINALRSEGERPGARSPGLSDVTLPKKGR